MVSVRPEAAKSSSAVYWKPKTAEQAVRRKDLESDDDVDLLIELLVSQSDAAELPEKFSPLFSTLFYFMNSLRDAEILCTDCVLSQFTVSTHTHTHISQCHIRMKCIRPP